MSPDTTQSVTVQIDVESEVVEAIVRDAVIDGGAEVDEQAVADAATERVDVSHEFRADGRPLAGVVEERAPAVRDELEQELRES